MASETEIGFVGLGAMGGPMVRQLAERHAVRVFDVDAPKVEALTELPGVTAAPSLRAMEGLGLTICMLPNSNIVETVTSDPGGLLDTLSPGSLIVDMGSSEPKRTVALAKVAAERGIELVDAPVSGGLARARTGELTAMFGGTPEQLERARPVLEPMTASIVAMGAVGSGHAMKALNNVSSAVGLTVACELIEVGKRFGLDPEVMLEVLNQSTGRNHATETKIDRFVLSESYDSGFLMRLMLKDLVIADGLSDAVGASTPIADACLALWTEAADLLPADADQTRIALMPGGLAAQGVAADEVKNAG